MRVSPPTFRLSIATKLYGVAILSLVAVGGLALAAVHFARVTEDAARELYQQGFVGVEHSARLQLRLEQHRRVVESAPVELDRERLEQSLEALTAIDGQLDELVKGSAPELVRDQNRAELAIRIADDLPDLAKFGREVISLAKNFAQDQAVALAQGDYDRVAKTIEDHIRSYRRKQHEIAENNVANLLSSAASLNRWTFFSTIATLLVIGPFGFWITRNVLSRLSRITRSIRRLARYDTTVEVPSRSDRDEVGDIARAVEVFKKNAIELLAKKAELEQTHLQLDVALNNMTHGLCMFDADERLIVCNYRFVQLYDLPPALTRRGTPLQAILQHGAAGGSSLRPEMERSSAHSLPADTAMSVFIQELRDGRTISISRQPMRDGGWVAVHEDITERRRAEEEITRLARTDILTGLPNRMVFRETINHGLELCNAEHPMAIFYLDADHFKTINDTLGHPMGDALLKAVAQRLQDHLGGGDLASRLGGDEFAIVQRGAGSREDMAAKAAHLMEVLSEPYEVQGHELVLGVSIGIAVAPRDGNDPDVLLKCADLALYKAKADGRRTFCFFEPELDLELRARRALESDLRNAYARQEFTLVYQPIVSLKTDGVCGFEALLRWHHPQHGPIPPDKFIPVAEEIGLIVPITEWVLRTACAEAANWPSHMHVAVNLSPVQFRHRHPLQPIINALAASGLPANRLEVELTESVFLHAEKSTVDALHELRSFGVRIAMDDFGTGYSALSYLRNFPFDKIKIDRSFINGLGQTDSEAIVELIVKLGAKLKMATVAEGVETPEQVERLRRLGCECAQGYFFSRPVPAAQILDVIAQCELSHRSVAHRRAMGGS